MSKLPSVSGKDAVKAFKKLGFAEDRTAGSHVILKKEGHEFLLAVPVHGNRDLKPGTLKGLLNASGATLQQFLEAL
jgi:predicted RNA binding protein YcfA (HicA-like mRNA interferase family)